MDNNIESPEIKMQKNELVLRDVVLKFKELIRHLLSKWVFILIMGAIGGALGLYFALTHKDSYEAKLTFILEENKSGAMGAYASIASSMGLDLGSSSNIGVFSDNNILDFLTSRLMVQKTLLLPVRLNGAETSLADYYIRVFDLKKEWEKHKESGLDSSFRFGIEVDRAKFSRLQDSVLNDIYLRLMKKQLVVDKSDKKSGFISVTCTTTNEVFSKLFTENLVEVATAYYIDAKTKRSKISVDALQAKADSIEALLNKKTYSAAASKDQILNINPARMVASVGSEVQIRDKTVLQTIYAEVIKNLEMSKASMAQATPVIQIIDTPIMPLEKKKLGKLKGIVIGAFVAGFIAILIVFTRKFLSEILKG